MTGAAAERRIDGGEMFFPETARMDSPRYQVIVIRAWREPEGLRIRLLADGSPPRQWVVGSITDARDVMGALLAELLTAADHQATPPHTGD
jgi:hypothetical protein